LKTFKDLGISEAFVKALTEMKIVEPTQIQAEAIPYLISNGGDFIGQAQTGTGKTAAYGLPILQKVDAKKAYIQALVLSPTRELTLQISKQFFKFTKYSEKIFTEAIYGGADIDRQVAALSRPTQILVATPGRLADLLKRKVVDISKIKTLVLDEADEMLSMGFKEQLTEILQYTKGNRNTWLFSATMPIEIKKIIDEYLSPDAYKIEVGRLKVINNKIQHQYLACSDDQKMFALRQFLKTQGNAQGMIFTKTKVLAEEIYADMIEKNYHVGVIHGDLLQKERDKVMRAFKNKKVKILIATDLTARGIDIQDLAYVVHYNVPDKLEYYTHRSGRTARAGKTGISLMFVTPPEMKSLRFIEHSLGISMDKISAKY